MFSGSTSSRNLDRVMTAEEVLKETKVDDCVTCRIMGATALFGLGAYSYFSGKAQLRIQEPKIRQSRSRFGMKSRQAGITSIALTLMGMGFWRLLWFHIYVLFGALCIIESKQAWARKYI